MSLYRGKTHTIETGESVLDVYPSKGARYEAPAVRINANKLVDVKVARTALVIRYEEFSVHEIRVEFDDAYAASRACDAVKKLIPPKAKNKQNQQADPLVKAASNILGGVFTFGKIIGDEKKREKEAQKRISEPTTSGTLTITTYVNGVERKKLRKKDDIKAVFLAEYVKSPRSVEAPWAKIWAEQYNIQDAKKYLKDLVREGYLEDAAVEKTLSTLTNDQLRELLKQLSMAAKGTKIVLIERLLNEADHDEVRKLLPAPVYELTNKGVAFLRSKRRVLEGQRIDCEKVINRR